MRLASIGLSLLVSHPGCGPGDPVATETGPASSGTTDDASTAAPTTGVGACVPPEGEELEVLLLADATLVVRPGSLVCGGAPRSCDCVSETIDRLVIELSAVAVGTYDYAQPSQTSVRIQCSMGDDGCSELPEAGSVTITRADSTCVAGTVNFGTVASGAFAVEPCPG